MVINPGEEFDFFGTVTVVNAVVDDEHLFPSLAGERLHEAHDHPGEALEEFAPVVAGIFEQGIGSVLFEAQGVIVDDAAVKVGADEGKEKDGSQHSARGGAAQLFDARLVQESAALKIVEEGVDPLNNAPCLLLFAKKVCSNHGSLFFPILLRILDNLTLPESKLIFTFKIQNFQ